MERNGGCIFDEEWVNSSQINTSALKARAKEIVTSRQVTGDNRNAWLLKAITCIDLTTLGGDDTDSNVRRLCGKAIRPIAPDLLKLLGFDYEEEDCPIHTAAVCVYPARVSIAHSTLKKMFNEDKINVASVATGFPSGQYPLNTRLDEIKFAVENGANEIDIVIDRSLVISGKWNDLYVELRKMKEACGDAHMKAILATGELGNYTNVYKASIVAMMAGADFIKTSTGKESINATIPFGIVMSQAIREYYRKTNFKVGLKPAGGIRTSKDALDWLIMVKELLGDDWLSPKLFRFGASGLLSDIEQELFEAATSKVAHPQIFSMG